MVLDYDVKLPEEKIEEPIVKDDKEEERKRLMTRASMNATALSAIQQPTGAGGPAVPPTKQGWGKVM